MTAGDSFYFAPGQAHQLFASDDEDFVYYVIADNPRGDTCYYPDSRKWVAFQEGAEEIIAKGAEADYYEGKSRLGLASPRRPLARHPKLVIPGRADGEEPPSCNEPVLLSR